MSGQPRLQGGGFLQVPPELGPGDRVWYRNEMRGDYGFEIDVPAEVIRETAARVVIRLWPRRGASRVITVKRDSIRAR